MKLLRVVSIVAVVAILGATIAWKMAPGLISSTLSQKMQVDVKIDDIGLSTDQIKVSKISIGNPEGSKLPTAFSADSITVNAPVKNYIQDAIVINEIALDNIYMSLEFTSPTATSGNWQTIMENLKKSSGPAPKEEKKDPTKKATSVLIKKLVLTNINVDLLYVGGVAKKLDPIARLEFTDISSESGVPLEQITNLILQQTLQSVLKTQNLGNILEQVISPKGVLEKMVNPLNLIK